MLMYFITTVSKDDNRCVGFYKSWFKAVKAVEENVYDLNEAGCYPYAVIERVGEGIYHYDFHPQWFKFNKTTERYEKISEPPEFVEKYAIGFGIG